MSERYEQTVDENAIYLKHMKRCSRTLNKREWQDFPGGPAVKNLPTNAVDMGPIASPGRFHMLQSNLACELQLLSPCSRARKLHQKKSPKWEASVLQLEEPVHSNEDPAQPKRKERDN